MDNAATISKNQLQIEESLLYLPSQERAFLACLMKYPSLMADAIRLVKKEWLYCGGNNMNAYVFSLMQYVFQESDKRGWQVDFTVFGLLSVARYLGTEYERRFLQRTDGVEGIKAIEAYMPHVDSSGFCGLANQLADTANRVEIFRKARAAMEAVQNRSTYKDSAMIAHAFIGDMSEIAYRSDNKGDDRTTLLSDCQNEFIVKCRINSASKTNLISLHLNHLPKLMTYLGGLRRRGLTIVTARPKIGKTTWAGQAAIQAAVNQNVPTLLLDSEMSKTELYSRSLSNMSRVKESEILAGKIFCGEVTSDMSVALDKLSKAPIYYRNVAGKNPEEVSAIIRQFRIKHVGTQKYKDPMTQLEYEFSKPGLVIYDWMKISSSSLKNAQEHQMLGFLATALKDAANANDLPILALGQNNREAAKVKSTTEWEDNAEIMVGGSDRLIQFCTSLITLRNLTREEATLMLSEKKADGSPKNMRDGYLPSSDGVIDFNSLLFNQVMHLVSNRFGPELRSGIPLYLHRGTSQYTEMGEDDNCMKLLQSFRTSSDKKQATPPQGKTDPVNSSQQTVLK